MSYKIRSSSLDMSDDRLKNIHLFQKQIGLSSMNKPFACFS